MAAYVNDLMGELSRRSVNYSTNEPERKDAPPFLTSQYTYPAKDELIHQHTSRFSLDAWMSILYCRLSS